MRVGLATLAHGRSQHLAMQARAVAEIRGLSRYLVVAMDDAGVPAGGELLRLPCADPHRLPLAAARNRAVAELADCDLVILLDVDCLPHPGMIEAFAAALATVPRERAVLFGPVGYLRDPVDAANLAQVLGGDAPMRVIRSFPAFGTVPEPRVELFWSLAFAVAPEVHASIGGFDEHFAGWGAEDTDYGRRAQASGMGVWKVAEAWAFHQPHRPVHRSPAHVAAVVENARYFHRRWGDWPMPDVLARLASDGQIIWEPGGAGIRCRQGVEPYSL